MEKLMALYMVLKILAVLLSIQFSLKKLYRWKRRRNKQNHR